MYLYKVKRVLYCRYYILTLIKGHTPHTHKTAFGLTEGCFPWVVYPGHVPYLGCKVDTHPGSLLTGGDLAFPHNLHPRLTKSCQKVLPPSSLPPSLLLNTWSATSRAILRSITISNFHLCLSICVSVSMCVRKLVIAPSAP